jgi:hypothetical protein
LWTCWALSDGSENQEEMDYIMAYNGSLWDGKALQTNFKLNYIYYDFPNTYSKHKDSQEIGMGFYWPKVFSGAVENLVPSYYVGRLWPSKSDGANRKAAGFIHIFGLDYDIPIDFGSKKDSVHFAAKAFYNDGMGGGSVDQDWSHILFSLTKNIPVGSIMVIPELNYQISMDDSVNTENELYTGITISYSF